VLLPITYFNHFPVAQFKKYNIIKTHVANESFTEHYWSKQISSHSFVFEFLTTVYTKERITSTLTITANQPAFPSANHTRHMSIGSHLPVNFIKRQVAPVEWFTHDRFRTAPRLGLKYPTFA
jgi:hypothetical protein